MALTLLVLLDGATSSQHDSLQPQRQHELMNTSSSESLRGKKRKRRERPVSLPSNVAKHKKDEATRPHLTTQSAYDNQDAKSTTSNQSQQKERHIRSVPSYTAIYNDNAIIQQRQNRPRLKLADFHILRTLGTGSFGRVHLVQSRVNARYYAVKVLKKSEVVRLKQGMCIICCHGHGEKSHMRDAMQWRTRTTKSTFSRRWPILSWSTCGAPSKTT